MRRIAIAANRAVLFVGSAALAVLPLIVIYDVAARYLFNAPTIWATEISIYLLQVMVFLPMGLLISEDGHVRSTLLTDRLSLRARSALDRVSLLLIAGFAGCVAWLGGIYTLHAWRFGQVSATLLAVPLWIPNALILLGGVLLFVGAVGTLVAGPAGRADAASRADTAASG